MMAQQGDELAHDDIWDDSALVSSWNEALDEYKKYHSIHANGGKLEDLPEYQQDTKVNPEPDSTSEQVEAPPDHHQAQSIGHDDVAVEGSGDAAKGRSGEGVTNGARNADLFQGSTGGEPMPPQALLGSMQDEGLKRLLMSWYYAGYYTGLYEGQQRQS